MTDGSFDFLHFLYDVDSVSVDELRFTGSGCGRADDMLRFLSIGRIASSGSLSVAAFCLSFLYGARGRRTRHRAREFLDRVGTDVDFNSISFTR